MMVDVRYRCELSTLQHCRRGVIVKGNIFDGVFLCVQGSQFVPDQNRLPSAGVPDQHDGPTVLQQAVHEVPDPDGLCGVDQACLDRRIHMGNIH